jgi:hypothetical protein
MGEGGERKLGEISFRKYLKKFGLKDPNLVEVRDICNI